MDKAGFMKDALILFAITLVSGYLLSGVYQTTKESIEEATIAANNKVYKAVFDEVESFEPDDALTVTVEGYNADLVGMDFGGVKVENVFKAVDGNDSQLGYVIISLPNDSYGGAVKVPVDIKEDGTITGIELLGIDDTSGLGLRAKEPRLKDQLIGKNAEFLSVTKMGNADDTQINATSGVAITSSAATNVVNTALCYLHNCIK